MPLPTQTVTLLKAAKQLHNNLPADAVLLVHDAPIDWENVRELLSGCRILVMSQNRALSQKVKEWPDVELIDNDPDPKPIEERMSAALLKAVVEERLSPGAHVVVLYNGIAAEQGRPEPIDSLSVLHLGEHLERMSSHDLRQLATHVPLETLRLVVDLATEIGREGREGKPVGTMFVVGDIKKVLQVSRPLNFNPFRGYPKEERDLRDKRVREAIKDLAQLEGAFLISREGEAVSGCMYIDVTADGITLSKGLGSRHWAAAAISRKTSAVAIAVSQSSGTVRVFQKGQVALHIEPLARPHIWQPFRIETQDGDVVVNPPRADAPGKSARASLE